MMFLYIKPFGLFSFKSGSHLLSHAVSSIVPSAAYVLTIVFGMRTGVSHKRIATRVILLFFCRPCSAPSLSIFLRNISRSVARHMPDSVSQHLSM